MVSIQILQSKLLSSEINFNFLINDNTKTRCITQDAKLCQWTKETEVCESKTKCDKIQTKELCEAYKREKFIADCLWLPDNDEGKRCIDYPLGRRDRFII